MPVLYCAEWVLPISAPPIFEGAVAVENDRIAATGKRSILSKTFFDAVIQDFGNAAIIPGLINAHSHLELTAMRGFLDRDEGEFFAWLRKLTKARLEGLTGDDLYVSAAWGACEAARAGVTCVADASDSARECLTAVRNVGLRGTIFQESFGPDPRLAKENFQKLTDKVSCLRELTTPLVGAGVSPHAPYTVCAGQLELIAEFAFTENLPLMMHAAESLAEKSLMFEGSGPFAEGLRSRGIEWRAPGFSPIEYLRRLGVLRTRPLLAHCIHVDDADLDALQESGTRVAHCPKSNAKLGHGCAPLAEFLNRNIPVGLGSDSVASNNTCDLLQEAQYAILFSRVFHGSGQTRMLRAVDGLRAATLGGARAVGREETIGELREGLQADLAVASLDAKNQLPLYHPEGTLIFASSGRDVILTMVAGREVYRDGQITTVDEERLRARMNEIATKLQKFDP